MSKRHYGEQLSTIACLLTWCKNYVGWLRDRGTSAGGRKSVQSNVDISQRLMQVERGAGSRAGCQQVGRWCALPRLFDAKAINGRGSPERVLRADARPTGDDQTLPSIAHR